MNLLQLVQRAVIECGVSNSTPSTTTGLTGELLRVKQWVQTAWSDIQSLHQDWEWLRKTATFTTIGSQATYSIGTEIAITDFGMWSQDTFRIYTTSAGYADETVLPFMDYETYRNTWQLGTTRTTPARPQVMTINPAKNIMLGPIPLVGYTVTGDYFSAPVELASDTDTPAIPVQYHMAIVYRAMTHYGMFEAAPEVMQRGEAEYRKMLLRLERDRLPDTVTGSPLA